MFTHSQDGGLILQSADGPERSCRAFMCCVILRNTEASTLHSGEYGGAMIKRKQSLDAPTGGSGACAVLMMLHGKAVRFALR